MNKKQLFDRIFKYNESKYHIRNIPSIQCGKHCSQIEEDLSFIQDIRAVILWERYNENFYS